MIFLILPVWWVPCFLVPIVLLVSLVPWWYTRGATPKGEPPERTHKKRRGEQHFKHEENKIQIRIVVIPYIVPMFFIERDLLKTCAALRIYPSAENPKKKHVSSESHVELQLPPGRLFQTASCWVPSWAPMRRHHLYGVGPGSWFMSPNFDVSSLRDLNKVII